MNGIKNKYNTPEFKPAAAVLPLSSELSAVALHIEHCAFTSIEVRKNRNNKTICRQFILQS